MIGFKVVIHSDHKNLSFNTFKSERVRRWRLLLEEYDYVFEYTPGKDNFIADMISRYPFHSSAVPEQMDLCAAPEINAVDDGNDDPCPIDYQVISHHQSNDQALQQRKNTAGYSTQRIHNNDLIFDYNRIALPSTLIDTVIQ